MVHFNSEHKTVLYDLLLEQLLVRPGKMFSFRAYYVGKELYICLYEQCVGIKLPEQNAAKLLATDQNALPFHSRNYVGDLEIKARW